MTRLSYFYLKPYVQVESVRRRRELLLAERERLEQERERWSSKLVKMEQFVLGGLGKDIAEFTIQVCLHKKIMYVLSVSPLDSKLVKMEQFVLC